MLVIFVHFQFILVLSEDGSGRGAAVAAAVATRMSRITEDHKESKRVAAAQNSNCTVTVQGANTSINCECDGAVLARSKSVAKPSVM